LNRENEKAMFASKKRITRKRTRNTGKGAKMGSHGFKVNKGTVVRLAKSTSGGWSRGEKPAPREEVIATLADMVNTDPSIKKIKKHIKVFSVSYSNKPQYGGMWDKEKKQVTIKDYPSLTAPYLRHTIIHEIVGHVFWDLSRKWRRNELVKFNELANSLPPVDDYVKTYENDKRNDEDDDLKLFKKSVEHIPDYDASDYEAEEYEEKLKKFEEKRKNNGHESMTRYANEQHSAITEIMYNDMASGKRRLINDSDKQKLIQAWKELHY